MKILKLQVTILLLILLISCSQDITHAYVEVVIPEHPWETYTGAKIWYTLKWTDGDGEHTKHVESSAQSVRIKVKADRTVYICAYPLSDMLPFGAAFTPASVPACILLTQDEGYLADIFMNLKEEVREKINWEALLQACFSKSEALMDLDVQMLVSAAMNGNLGKSSAVKNSSYEIGPFTVQNGVWVPERTGEGRVFVNDGEMEKMNVTPGVYRYYESEASLEMRIVCEPDGKSACVFKSATVSN